MNYTLFIAGGLSAIAALLHLGCIYFGAPWYRFFGAGEHMAILSERGSLQPTLITLGIFSVLSVWALYAFSGAGLLPRFPFLKTILVLITFIYAARGLVGFFFIFSPMGRSPQFWLYSSIVCGVIAIVHIVGLKRQWSVM